MTRAPQPSTVVILTERGAAFRVLRGVAGMILPVNCFTQAPGGQLMAHVDDARFETVYGRPQVWSLGEGDYILPKAQ